MAARLFDTHCHLDFAVFDPDRAAILQACRRRHIDSIILPGVEAEAWDRLLSLCAGNPGLYPALGLHPCFIDQHGVDDLRRLERLLASEPVVAVGEIGLDYWQGQATAPRQLEYFDAQLALAVKYRLPVLLHVRKAHDQVLQRLRRLRLSRGGIVHAFSGSYQQAEQYIEQGFLLGIGGALTYPRAQRLRRIVAALPLTALVLETDAPDMPLCGHQGQPNRPDRLPDILSVLLELRAEPAAQVAQALYRNAERLLIAPATG